MKAKQKKEKQETKTENKTPTIVSVFKALAETGVKDRAEAVQKILNHFKAKGITKNSKGRPIEEARVTALVNAILRDIKTERKGWWSTYKIEESDDELKIVKKE